MCHAIFLGPLFECKGLSQRSTIDFIVALEGGKPLLAPKAKDDTMQYNDIDH